MTQCVTNIYRNSRCVGVRNSDGEEGGEGAAGRGKWVLARFCNLAVIGLVYL